MDKLRTSNQESGILHLSFNQDQGCFVVGTTKGFFVFSREPLKLKQRRVFEEGGIGCAEMLFRCNFLALVGGGRFPKYPVNKVMIWDDRRRQVLFDLPFKSDVKGVCLRRDRIVVVLETRISVFNFTQSPQRLQVYDTCPNNKGLCVLCSHSDNSLMVFPGAECGQVQMVDMSDSKKAPSIIAAHETSLACLALNLEGTLLATASEKGTLIRIFDTKTGRKVGEVRRGADRATICSISFSPNSKRICVSSDKGTVHVFELDEEASAASATSLMRPRSFARFAVTSPYSICCFSADGNAVTAVCADGNYIRYNLADEKASPNPSTQSFLSLMWGESPGDGLEHAGDPSAAAGAGAADAHS